MKFCATDFFFVWVGLM